MTTITPLRAAAGAAAATLAVAALGLGAGYAWGHAGDAAARVTTLPAALAASSASPGSAGAAGITVTGTGTVSGTPDTLRLSMGVSVTASTVTAALDAANTAAGKVQAALRQHGVADKDLQTSGLSIQPQYTDVNSKPTISGYQVSETLTAALRDLKTAGAGVTAAVQAGGDATRVDAVSLDLSDTGALVTAARAKAFALAKAKAQQYAQAAGVQLGDVLSISEAVSTSQPVPYAAVPMAAEAGAKAVPVAAGSQDVAVNVTVVFALG